MSPARKSKNSADDLHERASELIDAGAALERILIELYPHVEGEVGLYDVIMDKEVRVFQDKNNEVLGALGYTEHGIRHQSNCLSRRVDSARARVSFANARVVCGRRLYTRHRRSGQP